MASEITLKYGCNPNQKPARIFIAEGELPLAVLNGRPGYINFLDALNGYQLVRELQTVTGLPAATSFKHVSPAGAALGLPLDDTMRQVCAVSAADLSPLAAAYARARGADRMSSFGDFIALSDPCDAATARLIAQEVSDGVIAPGYSDEALAILQTKRQGNYNVIQIDADYHPHALERKEVFGITFEQNRNDLQIDEALLADIVSENKSLPAKAKRDLLLALMTLKYTQSNSVCYAMDGQVIGVGAGQQSRIHCTRLAGNKADNWQLRHHPQVLQLPFLAEVSRPNRDNAIDLYVGDDGDYLLRDDVWPTLFERKPVLLAAEEKKDWLRQVRGVSLASDAFFPFDDNIERAHRSGVSYVAEPGGSLRDRQVIDACDRYGIVLAFTHIRLFHH